MRKALVVGIDHYPEIPLRGCVNDAAAFADIIETNGDGSQNFAIRRMLNVSTKAALRTAIAELFEGNNEIALFYFSGHGFLNEIGGYVMTPDHKRYDEGVSMDDILTLANRSRAQNKVIILDCCHSGAFGSPHLTGGAAQLHEGIVVLTASRSTEVAIEVNGHGIFTNLLLEAFRGGAADLRGNVTSGSIYAYVDQALGAWDQRPVFKTNVSRFTPLRTIIPPIPLETLKKIIEYFPTPDHEFPLDPTYEYTNTDVVITEHEKIFKNLQRLEGVSLVVPVGEEHMYWAAQNSKACRLTPLGGHYWRLAKERRI